MRLQDGLRSVVFSAPSAQRPFPPKFNAFENSAGFALVATLFPSSPDYEKFRRRHLESTRPAGETGGSYMLSA